MATLSAQWSAYIDQQHRHPTGLIGKIIGERMRRQHTPETAWTVEQLQLAAADRVLEVGFGAGRGLALTLQHTHQGHITGIDLSPTMIRSAAQRNRTALAEQRLSLLRGDIAHLPFGKQQFDKIFSIHTFYFWPDQAAILEQLLHLLAPGGRLISTFATAHTSANGERIYWPLHQRAEEFVQTIAQQTGVTAQLINGPDSRQYNNVAIVVKSTAL